MEPITASAPIGTVMRNRYRQLTDVTSQPPSVGPTAGATMAAMPQMSRTTIIVPAITTDIGTHGLTVVSCEAGSACAVTSAAYGKSPGRRSFRVYAPMRAADQRRTGQAWPSPTAVTYEGLPMTEGEDG